LQHDNYILATGGGTPCFFDNINLMNENGVTVYFKLSPQALFKRLRGSHATRPLISSFNHNELLSYIETKLKEREPWYLQSKLVIEESEQNPKTIAGIISNYNP
jgi:shikimate kinase